MRILALLFLALAACSAPKPVDPCAENPCGAGLCSAVNGQAFCLCNPGFTLQGSTCVSVSMASCEPNPCTGGKTCSIFGGEVQCACPADLVEDQGRCVSAACAAAHCGQVPHQTVCTVTGNVASCSCESGFVPTASGCSELPVFDCAAQHTGQGADPHEPNECPTQANPLVPGLAQQHTLVPAGDVDWLSLRAAAGHVIEVTASTSNGGVVLDVMGSDGLTTLASNHRATTTPSVRLRVPSTNADPLYVRVSSFDPSALAAYEVTTRDLGTDDFPDTVAQARLLVAGAPFAGEVQLEGDVDVVRLASTAGDTWRFELTSSAPVDLEVLSDDGATVRVALGTASRVATVVADGASLYLRARGHFATSVGAFNVTTSPLGPDDHGDDPTHATPVTANGLATLASWERADDVDVLRAQVIANHDYTLSCSSTRGCRAVVTTSGGVVLLNDASTSTLAATFRPVTSGTVYLQFSPNTPGAATWSWTLTDTSVDDVGDTNATASSLAIGGVVNAGLQTTADHDLFTFTAQAGHAYQVTCSSAASYLCAMTVRDAGGATLGSTSYGYGSPTNVLFTTASAGAVFIDVYGSASTGTYTVELDDLGADDHGNTTATATAVQLGAATSGVITSGDVDVLSFTATSGTIYGVACATSASYLCAMTVRDANGTSVVTTTYGTNTNANFVATSSGTHTVEVRSYYSGYTGAYTVTITNAGSDDHGNTPATATSVTVGASVNGSTQFAYDTDVFAFTAQAGHIYVATCTASSSYLCAMTVRNAAGTSVATTSYGTSTTTTFVAAAAGTFTVEVSPYSTGVGSYVFRVTDGGSDDFGDTPATAGTVTVGATTSGNHQFAGDKDVAAFVTTTNRLYTVSCTSVSSYGCALTVRDAAGVTVVTTSYGTSTTTGFKATSAGPYTVEVRNYYSYTGAWTLTVTDAGADDHGDTDATGTTLGTSASGNIQVSGDKDVFVFTATADTVYRFTCTTTTYLCTLVARSPTGVTLASSSYGTSTSVSFKAGVAGRYAVEVSGYSGYTGAYSVTLGTQSDDHGDTPGTASTLTLGSLRTGNLDYQGDVDYFAVSLTAGTTYTVTVNSASIPNTVYDPTLGVVTLSARSFTATTSGTHYLRVSATASLQGPYSVLIQ